LKYRWKFLSEFLTLSAAESTAKPGGSLAVLLFSP
jgi:hypothetical protein